MPTLILEHGPHGGAGVVGRALHANGLRTHTICLSDQDALPADLDDVDGVAVCGGQWSACNTSLAWLDSTRAFVKTVHEAGKPILGLGSGGHIVAQAIGGRVGARDGGARAGLATVRLTPTGRDDPLFRGLPWYGTWPVWGGECVADLPEGAKVLASSDGVNEAWVSGVWTYGVEFEAQWNVNTLMQFCDDVSLLPNGATVDSAALRAEVAQHAEAIDRQAARFAANVASYLHRTVTPAAGR